MSTYYYGAYFEPYLSHHGVKGQRWGVRRYQNADGSLTAAGQKHQAKTYTKQLNKLANQNRKKLVDYRYAKLASDSRTYRYKVAKEKGAESDKLAKYAEKMKLANKKVSEISDSYKANTKQINSLLKSINVDPSMSYRTYMGMSWKYNTSVTGTNYKVSTNSKKIAKWDSSDTKYKSNYATTMTDHYVVAY